MVGNAKKLVFGARECAAKIACEVWRKESKTAPEAWEDGLKLGDVYTRRRPGNQFWWGRFAPPHLHPTATCRPETARAQRCRAAIYSTISVSQPLPRRFLWSRQRNLQWGSITTWPSFIVLHHKPGHRSTISRRATGASARVHVCACTSNIDIYTKTSHDRGCNLTCYFPVPVEPTGLRISKPTSLAFCPTPAPHTA